MKKRANARFALSATILTLAIVAVVSASATGFVLLSSSSSSPIHSVSSTQSESGWQLVRSNVTVYGMPAFLGQCVAIAAWCPTTPIQDFSLTVNLINYKGTYYYVHSGEIFEVPNNSTVGTSVSSTALSQTTSTYTAWFTNSTVYCVTPDMNTASITCPS